jgi:myo-inositol 2-dehydrogenase/D-chiro-inositol 1-dehydrogenase
VWRVAVVGTGLMGELHARNLRTRVPGAELVALADTDEERASALADELGVAATGDGLGLIGDERVDAVVVASPDVTHTDYALACIAAGKPVLCEKPLAATAASAESVLEAESAGGRRLLQVGFMREFDAAHIAVHEAMRSGRIGRPVMFRGTHVNPFPVGHVAVEQAITQSMIHDFNSARFLLGREIVDVYSTWVPLDVAADRCQIVTVSATFDDGSLGLIDVNMQSGYGYTVSAEVVGTAGVATTAHPTGAVVLAGGRRSVDVPQSWAARFAPAYLGEMEAWVGSLHTGVPVGPGAWDGYAANAVADAAVASARHGTPVAVDMRERFGIYAT